MPEPLTPAGRDVVRFATAKGSLAYAARPQALASPPGVPINASATAVTGVPAREILFPELERMRSREQAPAELWIGGVRARDSRTGTVLKLPRESFLAEIALSPDARRAIVLTRVEDVPQRWEKYETSLPMLRFHATASMPADEGRAVTPYQYVLLDLERDTASALLDAPNAWAGGIPDKNSVAWSPSGARVVLTNTYMPEGKHPCAATVVVVAAGTGECLVSSRYTAGDERSLILERGAFEDTEDDVTLRFRRGPQRVVERYRRSGAEWKLVKAEDDPVPARLPTTVAVKEDLDTPAALWATDVATGQSRKLWDPNPQLASLAIGGASVFQWQDAEGRSWTGALIKPPGFTTTRRYPVVIQTHGFTPDEFLTDGAYTTAFAGRPLAAAGIVVLQVPSTHRELGTRREATINVAGILGALDKLEREGIADRRRVGIIGFSRTSWYVKTALVEAPERFAAATIADGIDHGYMQYLLFGESKGQQREQDMVYGSTPFGEGLARWAASAPTFQFDRVKTPLRIEAVTAASLLAEWEGYAALRMQGKAVDLIYFPEAQHILQRPLERMASQQGNVDWFRFWLKDEIDPDPEKAVHYERWKKLRSMMPAAKPAP